MGLNETIQWETTELVFSDIVESSLLINLQVFVR